MLRLIHSFGRKTPVEETWPLNDKIIYTQSTVLMVGFNILMAGSSENLFLKTVINSRAL
jgi:hypothetical protein